MRSICRRVAVVMAVGVASGCAARVPVVVDPVYPTYLFPTVPSELARSDAAGPHDEAWRYLQTGDLPGAEIRYRQAVDATAGFYPGRAGLGWVSLARNDAETAADHFGRVVETQPGYLPALVGHADALFLLDRTEEALVSYEAALRIDPGLARVVTRAEELRFTVAADRLARARDAAAAGRFDEAIAAYDVVMADSPESGFLHLEVARVERARGSLGAATRHALEASRLDPNDAEAFLLLGAIYEAQGELPDAVEAYERADAIDPSEETARRIDRINDLLAAANLPREVLAIATRREVTRGELAALLGVRLPDVLAAAQGQPVIITDTREHWGGSWIQSVAGAGVMEVDAAYRFDPDRAVRRSELAEVVSATLDLIEAQADTGPLAGASTESFTDIRPSHLSYEAAMRAVSVGVLDRVNGNSFQPSRVVTGGEAVDAVDRLAELVRELF